MRKLNSLETFLRLHHLNGLEAMNALQAEGIVADEAILPRDVAEMDCGQAIAFLAGLVTSKSSRAS